MAITIEMPKLSDAMEEGVILEWLLDEKDSVSAGDILVRIETDKAAMGLEASDDGVLVKKIADVGDTVPVGEVIAVLMNRTFDGYYPGYVYVLLNSAYGMDKVKIGLTTRDPEERAHELSRSTGVPVSFTLIYSAQVPNCREIEQRVHSVLEQKRINPNREFFEIAPHEAVSIVNEQVLKQVFEG